MDRAERIHAWCKSQEIPCNEEFYETFTDSGGLYILDEGPLWDFKQEWPFSYSNPYFAGIARLICAFSNTWGGVIIFGVHDEKREGGHNKVLINADKLRQSFQQITGSQAQFQIQRYSNTAEDGVVALFVKPRPHATRPYRFLTPLASYPAGALWVRAGHQIVQATPRDYPVLFCRAGSPLDETNTQDVQGSLPPSPTTLKRFVGRASVMDSLFDWLQSSDEPRTFLFGKGGSGKTSIAYEFAKLLRNSGGDLTVYGGRAVDTVIFLSAKEKSLLTTNAQIVDISEPDFADETSLHQKILQYGRWILDDAEIAKLTPSELRFEVKNFFDVSTCVLVLDDVDTLTTKGIDAGFDFLYRILSRTNSGSKVLYTLRNAPSHSLPNSIEVPGLATGGDYEEFVEACASQFGVSTPRSDFRDGQLASMSERRPLVIESIIALVRTAASYKRAAELFQQHAGADVREYVFLREWDALPADGLARMLLVALSELGRASTFKDLETVLQVEATQVQDAIGAVREMFLQIEGAGDETTYSLAQLTKQFVNSKKPHMARYDVLKARIQSFRRYVHTASPEVAKITMQVERLLPQRAKEYSSENAVRAWALVTDASLSAAVSEAPIFRAVKGYVACCLNPPRITDAREAFSYARKMAFEPDYHYLKVWMIAEKANGQIEGGIDVVTDTVLRGKRYTAFEKAFMASRKASSLYFRGRERQFTDTIDAEKDFREALRLHLFVYHINVDEGHHWALSTFKYAENTAFSLFGLILQSSTPWDVADTIISCLELDAAYADPIEAPLVETLERIVASSTRPELANRYRNKLKALEGPILAAKWAGAETSGRLSEKVRAAENALTLKIRPQR